jgi:glycosyltransferase involved in cell wall biosynthesis
VSAPDPSGTRLSPSADVAIVHDYLNQRGGAERVVLEMARLWPEAPIYTSLYRPDSTLAEFRAREIRASILDRLPVDRRFRALLPLYPLAFRSLGTLQQGLVISSSSGWAHGVRTGPATRHVVYCHAPARWIYERDVYLGSTARKALFGPVLTGLGRWDRHAARRADAYIANSQNVRDRVREIYGLDAEVVYPPVDTNRFQPTARGRRLLVVSRLLPYKRIDLAIEAASRAGIALDIVGTGPMLGSLRRLAGPEVVFHGAGNDATVGELIQGCWALCVPGAEDFGIVSIEANAAGKPVIAFDARGARETIEEGRTGVLFAEQSVSSLLDAIERADSFDPEPEQIARHARRFSVEAFRRNLTQALERILGGDVDQSRAGH